MLLLYLHTWEAIWLIIFLDRYAVAEWLREFAAVCHRNGEVADRIGENDKLRVFLVGR